LLLLADQEIEALIAEPKKMKCSPGDLLDLKSAQGHVGKTVDIDGADEHRFKLIIRRSNFNVLDFSAILGFVLPNNVVFRLRRYNGKSHQHRNSIEGTAPFYDFHIHYATTRYQQVGNKDEESFALSSDKYSDLWTAISCLVVDCNISYPNDSQLSIFEVNK
jgi:hypothetical protein